MPEPYTSETYKGLPSHGALFEMAGQRWEQIQQIETAITSYAQALAGMLGGAGGGGKGGGGGSPAQQLPNANTNDPFLTQTFDFAPNTNSMSTSVGHSLVNLSDEAMSAIQANIADPEIWNAFQTILANFPANEPFAQGAFIVHPETFERSIVEKFSGATTIYDLNEALHELQWNEDLRGLDQIEDVTYEIETPWGNNVVTISPSSGASSSPGGQAQQAIQQIMSFLQSAMNHTPNKNENQFGSGAQSIGEQIQRVAFDTQAKIQKTIQECQSDKEGNKACDDLQTSGSTMISTCCKVG
jgi:hypothetical protein